MDSSENILNILVKVGVVGSADLAAVKQLLEDTGHSAEAAGKALAESDGSLVKAAEAFLQIQKKIMDPVCPDDVSSEKHHESGQEPARDIRQRERSQNGPVETGAPANMATAQIPVEQGGHEIQESAAASPPSERPAKPAQEAPNISTTSRVEENDGSVTSPDRKDPPPGSAPIAVGSIVLGERTESSASKIASLIHNHQNAVEEQWRFLAGAYTETANRNAQAWEQIRHIFGEAASSSTTMAFELQALRTRFTELQAQIKQTGYLGQ